MEEFKIGEPILVRSKKDPFGVWEPRIYLGAKDNAVYLDGGWRPARDDYSFIPFNEETEDMLGSRMTWEEPWEPTCGELVAVKDEDDTYWKARIFVKKDNDGLFLCAYYNTVDEDDLCPWEECEPIHKHFNVPKCPSEDA